MNFDLPTLLSVLGVVLTIVFFVVGYRQTIGARRERARAANKNISDALLRRFTLEPHFLVGPVELNKILSGFAIDARIRLSDIYSLGEVEALLLFRVVESDYISADQRKEIMQRIEECFKQTSRPAPPRRETRNQNRLKSELWLAIASSVTALIGTIIGAFSVVKITPGVFDEFSTDRKVMIFALVTILIVLTAAALIVFVRLKENAASVDERDILTRSRGFNFERDFLAAARAENQTVELIPSDWADFSFRVGEKRIAVITKIDINETPSRELRGMISRIEGRCKQEGYASAYIASFFAPTARVKRYQTELVKIAEDVDVLDVITHSRGGAEQVDLD